MGVREKNRAAAHKSWRGLNELSAVAQALKLDDKPLEWERPAIGLYWRSKGGEFSISAYRQTGPMPQPYPQSGFELRRLTFVEGRYPSLEKAKEGAEAAKRQTVVVVRTGC